MRYRSRDHKEKQKTTNDVLSDVFDGSHFDKLSRKQVKVGDVQYSHRYFSGERDIALGLSTDGFGPFRRRKHSAWPLLIFNYNLPPETRFHQENIICIGVIPGPKAVKDLDSFLIPLIEELALLACGVRAYDALTRTYFALRAYLILAFGDMPAIAKLMRMRGHNGIMGCRMCAIRGVRCPTNPGSTAHYFPLDRSCFTREQRKEDHERYDPLNLPLRTHAEIISQANHVADAPNATQMGKRATNCGINGPSSLFILESIDFPTSFPFDFMHLVWENLIPNLVALWTGNFKDLPSADYNLSKSVWDAIGEATAAAGSTYPYQFGARVPNISDKRHEFKADNWSFWTLYLAPILLHNRFSNPAYYTHFVELVRLLQLCMQFEISREAIEDIRQGFADWVVRYEEYVYWRYFAMFDD